MAPKKPKRNNNKKKSKGQQRNDHAEVPAPAAASLTQVFPPPSVASVTFPSGSGDDDSSPRINLDGGLNIPTLALSDSTSKPPPASSSSSSSSAVITNDDDDRPTVSGIYGVYKLATQRFKDGLAALVPDYIFAMDRVQALMDAADYLVEQQQHIDPKLLEDCRLSLQFRKSYSKQFEGGGDQGHSYFILVLNYCFQSLKHLVTREERKTVKEKANKRFSFTDLELESDSEDEADEEDVKAGGRMDVHHSTSRPPQRPAGPEEELTLQDLIDSTDRFKANVFLSDVGNAMNIISNTYLATKKCMFSPEKQGMLLMGSLLTNGVITNFTIREVQLMEAQLKIECPHLTTFYRVIACVFMSDQIDNLMGLIKDFGTVGVPRPDATAFVGDVVEQVFWYPATVLDRIDHLIHDFCGTWSLPQPQIKDCIGSIVALVRSECMPAGFLRDKDTFESLKASGATFHVWMNGIPFIGGDRSIINTLSLLQLSAKALIDKRVGKIGTPKDLYGKLWDEQECLAQSIRGDMDQLLMQDILPELLFACQYGLMSQEIPKFDELLPLFNMLKDFVENPEKPVSLSLAFGIHAVLTSIYQLQGDNNVATIAKFAKDAYNRFFDQIEPQLRSELAYNANWKLFVTCLVNCRAIPQVILTPVNERSEERAFWNPCCAAMFLTHLTYYSNLEGGSHLVDHFQQLRLVLHLYNALRQRNLIDANIPVVSSLDHFFDGVSIIWQGGKPERDNIVKKFLIVNGRPLEAIRHLYEETRQFVLGQPITPRKKFDDRRINFRKTKKAICVPDSLKSFQDISFGDYRETTGIGDNNMGQIWNAAFVRRMKDAIRQINSEVELFSMNFAAAAFVCDKFLRVLVQKEKWKPLLNRVIANKPQCSRVACHMQKERVALCEVFSLFLLGPLEFLDSVEQNSKVMIARNCLEEFFCTLDPSEYQFVKTFNDDSDGASAFE